VPSDEARPAKLDDPAIDAGVEKLEDWSREGDGLRAEFHFADFNGAFAFMMRSALVAEQLDHHPKWSNVYNRVRVHLTTHDAGGITPLDLDLAARMSEFARANGARPAG